MPFLPFVNTVTIFEHLVICDHNREHNVVPPNIYYKLLFFAQVWKPLPDRCTYSIKGICRGMHCLSTFYVM